MDDNIILPRLNEENCGRGDYEFWPLIDIEESDQGIVGIVPGCDGCQDLLFFFPVGSYGECERQNDLRNDENEIAGPDACEKDGEIRESPVHQIEV